MIGKEVVLFHSLNNSHEIINTKEFQRKSIVNTINYSPQITKSEEKNVSVTKQCGSVVFSSIYIYRVSIGALLALYHIVSYEQCIYTIIIPFEKLSLAIRFWCVSFPLSLSLIAPIRLHSILFPFFSFFVISYRLQTDSTKVTIVQ